MTSKIASVLDKDQVRLCTALSSTTHHSVALLPHIYVHPFTILWTRNLSIASWGYMFLKSVADLQSDIEA